MKKDQAIHCQNNEALMDEKIVWFVYYTNGRSPCSQYPDLNQYFKHFNGKFGWLQKLYFVWLRQRGACKRFTGILFAIIPDSRPKESTGI